MSRRSTTKTTVITSTVKPSPGGITTIDMTLLRDDPFDKRPKTDYTYSRSATYSSKYVDGKVISPNLSRRRLYTDEMIRDQQAASALMLKKAAAAAQTTNSSHVRVYGGRSTRNSLASNNQNSSYSHTNTVTINNANNNAANASLNGSYTAAGSSRQSNAAVNAQIRENLVQHTVYTTRNSNQAQNTAAADYNSTMHLNNNNSVTEEAIFSEDEADSNTMSRRSTSKRKTTRRASSRSRSPGRNVRGSGATRRRSTRLLDQESEDSVDIMSGGGLKSSSYSISGGLDSDSDIVTERSSTVIDTVTTGTPLAAKIMGCFMFLYGCTCIFVNRVWYSFGHPVYATLQRYLLLDSWVLSRGCTRWLRALLLGLLLFLIPLALLMGTACSLHALGFVNVSPCAPLTGVYYVSKQSDLNAPGIGANIKNKLSEFFTWSSTQQARQPPPVVGKSTDWGYVIDSRIENLKATIEQDSHKVVSEQRQKNTELEAAVSTLTRDLDSVNTKLSSISTLLADLNALKLQVSSLQTDVRNIPDHSAAISQLQKDIQRLQNKLGDVQISDDQTGAAQSGVLMYMINEINNLKSSVNAHQTTPAPALPCPDSSCVCENDLGLRLRTLHEKIIAEMNERDTGTGTTLYVSSENSTGISEQLVRKIIQDELDIFAEDRTGMPDFALQSMGAQVVSTRCSQSYYEDTGIMTFLGLPLYHLHKEPSVVIQPGVEPGECWCFHGQAGTLVIEMADLVKFNSFSIEHISAKQSVTGEISSAPKDIAIFGLTSELDTNGQKIGQWTYNKNGHRLQFFPVEDMTLPGYPLVELRVLSNWGKEEFTCLYRFRVHGKLAPK